jgi:hypothetical protein
MAASLRISRLATKLYVGIHAMNVDAFEASLTLREPSREWESALQALWWDAQGDWERAHSLVQMDEADRRSAWVHAYLHRKEGDLANAAYWYRQAGQPVASGSLPDEWRTIAATLLMDDCKA